MKRADLAVGVLFALGAGATWGLVFIAPLLLPDYPAALQSFGRYLAFGLVALVLGGFDRRALARLEWQDWLEAMKLALVGNLVYYLLLASAIRRVGAPLPTMVIGTLPVVIALVARHGAARRFLAEPRASGAERPIAWRRLAPSLLAIAAGIALVHHAERAEEVPAGLVATPGDQVAGLLLAIGAVVCWTWYPLRNAAWLRARPDRPARAWATAQGIATLPLALVGYLGFWLAEALGDPLGGFSMPFGPRPAAFLGLMFGIGLLASWLGTLCWNEASRRLPATLAGQLIVFETLAALVYAFVLRGRWPPAETVLGAAALVAGVAWAARAQAGRA